MSLLLDALKKAAQQKAEKSRQEEVTEASSPDETLITAAADQTELEIPDSTLTQTPSLSAQIQTGEDETIVFAEEDISDFLGEPELVSRERKSHDDATEVDQTEYQTQHTVVEAEGSDDATELDQTEYQTHHEPGDATEVDQTEYQTHHEPGDATEVDQTEYQTHHEPGDATEIDQTEYQAHHEPGDATEVDQTEYQTHHEPGDATELDQTEYQAHHEPGDATEVDQTEYQAHHEPGDATEVDQTEYQAHHEPGDATEVDQTEYQTQHTAIDAEGSDDATELQHDTIQDEDMSLLLVDRDDTNLTSQTSMTDPQTPQNIARAIASDNTAMDDLALVDTTRHQIPGEETETSAATQTSATTGIASATQITPHATTRMDSTSTETYAPDNYDRTLIKLPSDDESKIFAGMKSDVDVVMTPDYAKKVFRSKSSAQRMHVYKVYSGIVVVILLTIGIYGAFEFQDESDSIDSSLRPLKRDPMPGIIRLDKINQESSLIAESGTNARTIEIIESADSASGIMAVDEGVITDEGVAADEGVIAEEVMATDDVTIAEKIVEADNSAVIAESAAPAQAEPVTTTQVASVIQVEAIATDSASNSSTLEIISSSQIEQKDLWLREAYNAYKSGDSSRAMTLYNQVLVVDPGNRNALLARAAIYVQNNNSNAAIKDYQALLLRNPKDSLAMTSLITVANFSPRETESQLKLMIRDEPDSPYLNFALANAYGAQNRWQEAQGYYFKALENNPGDPNYAYNLAVSLEHIAQPLAAVSYYRRALNNINNSLATFNQEIVSQRVEILAKQ